jgi:hypothetical protein
MAKGLTPADVEIMETYLLSYTVWMDPSCRCRVKPCVDTCAQINAPFLPGCLPCLGDLVDVISAAVSNAGSGGIAYSLDWNDVLRTNNVTRGVRTLFTAPILLFDKDGFRQAVVLEAINNRSLRAIIQVTIANNNNKKNH